MLKTTFEVPFNGLTAATTIATADTIPIYSSADGQNEALNYGLFASKLHLFMETF